MFDPDIAITAAPDFWHGALAPGLPAPILTPRESEVLAVLASGATNKEIARRLGISFHTVKFHVAAILEKLGTATRTEAVTKAARLGIVVF